MNFCVLSDRSCCIEFRHTTSQELYPMNTVDQNAQLGTGQHNSLGSSTFKHADSARFEKLLQQEMLDSLNEGDAEELVTQDNDATLWSTERVRKWLVQVGLEELYSKKTNFVLGFCVLFC
jgi:hypothetical protein